MKRLQGERESLWSHHISTFPQLLLMTTSRRFGVRLIGFLWTKNRLQFEYYQDCKVCQADFLNWFLTYSSTKFLNQNKKGPQYIGGGTDLTKVVISCPSPHFGEISAMKSISKHHWISVEICTDPQNLSTEEFRNQKELLVFSGTFCFPVQI